MIKLVLYEPCPGPNFAGSMLRYDSGSLLYSCLTRFEANLRSVERVAVALSFATISPKGAKCIAKNGTYCSRSGHLYKAAKPHHSYHCGKDQSSLSGYGRSLVWDQHSLTKPAACCGNWATEPAATHGHVGVDNFLRGLKQSSLTTNYFRRSHSK